MQRRQFLALLSSTNWPSFRGPNATGTLPSADPPLQWDRPLWTTPIPGAGHASPVVWGDSVYVITAVPAGAPTTVDLKANDRVVFAEDRVPHTWKLLALHRATGRIRWQSDLHQATPRQARHSRGSYANATPATDGRRIVVSLWQEAIACVDAKGRLRWKKDIRPADPKAALDAASSPVIDGNLVFLQCDWSPGGFLLALDLDSGNEVWRKPRAEGHSWTTPAVYRSPQGESVLVANSSRRILGYRTRDGAELWSFDNSTTQPWDRIPAPVVTGDLVIVTGGAPDRPIYAIRTSASGEVKPEHLAWTTGRGAPYMSTPLALDGLLYTVQGNGILTAYELSTGARLYQQRLGCQVSASPVGVPDRVCLLAEDGTLFSIKSGRTYELLAKASAGEPCLATPALSGRLLIARGISRVAAFGQPAK
ncbi:MAG: PQQ-binding-like beta-propeller repeat protein [Bryobacteraceae bacterium]|nr:PQQ-binding-like beta-propeller repeat protein [Bryobacteraceae bacterium]